MIHLEWSATPGSPSVIKYEVHKGSYWADGSLVVNRIAELDGTQLQYDDDTNVEPGIPYRYLVVAHDENHNDVRPNPETVYGWAGTPAEAVDVSATQGKYADKVRITWDVPDGAQGSPSYTVRRKTPNSWIALGPATNNRYFDDTNVVAGVRYTYRVETYGDLFSSDPVEGWVGERPDNDDFEDAWAISGVSGSSTSTNICATCQAGEPFLHDIGEWDFRTNTLWWAWTAPMDGVVQFNTEGSVPDWDPDDEFDTVMAVYTGSSLASLTEVAFNDDTAFDVASSVRFAVDAGTTYRIQVAGKYSGDVGAIRLNWSYPRPDNDDFEDAWAISGKSGSSTSTNTNATHQVGEPFLHELDGYEFTSNTLWWAWTAPTDGIVQFNTEGSVPGWDPDDEFDSVMAVYTGSSLASLTEVAFSDDINSASDVASSNQFAVAAGTTYRIQVAGKYSGDVGAIRLNWSYTHFRVTLDPNGGTISTNAVMVPAGQKLGVALQSFPVPVRAGYRLTDWKFENNASVTASAAFAITESHALHAEWAYISSNDDFEDALPLDSPGQTSGFSALPNTNATLQAGEPLLSAYPNATHTIWWTWTAPANGTAHFSTTNSVDTHGGQIDTVIGVYTGSTLGSLVQVATGEDGVNDSGFIGEFGTFWSFADFAATNGTTYYICVGVNDKYNRQVVEGMIRLNWSLETSGVSSGGFALLPPGSSGLDIPLALGQVADPAVGDVIGGSVSNYNDFAEWANGKGANGVRASRHAAASYLLGTTSLLQNNPVITIDSMVVTNGIPLPSRRGSPSDVVSLTLTVSVTDGGEPVEVTAAKVAALFEATTDLSDWESPATKLDPHAEAVTTGSATTVTIRVTPGDGTAPRAFLRIRR